MATNLALELAFQLSGEKTKKAAVTKALEEFIARRAQRRLVELFGSLDWNPSCDYKAVSVGHSSRSSAHVLAMYSISSSVMRLAAVRIMVSQCSISHSACGDPMFLPLGA